MKESGRMIRCTARASINMLTIAATSATIKMTNSTVKECTSGLMVINTSASLLMIKDTEKVVLNGLTVANIQEDGRRTNYMEQEFTSTQRKKNFTVNGSMAR